ncbi:transcriptional regulator LeuO [Vibrio cholerae]|nr:transcriptional regulator LeuO [Vibrio cholerae]
MLDKKDAMSAIASYRMESTLRGVDLNLLTVFDAVMQEQNITRAAHNLGMSQPAVSNAVARLKVMFNDELFMRQGRGIQPTQRARQLFGPIRQALQLILTSYRVQFSHRKPQRVCLSSRSAVLAIYALLLRSWHRLMN